MDFNKKKAGVKIAPYFSPSEVTVKLMEGPGSASGVSVKPQRGTHRSPLKNHLTLFTFTNGKKITCSHSF